MTQLKLVNPAVVREAMKLQRAQLVEEATKIGIEEFPGLVNMLGTYDMICDDVDRILCAMPAAPERTTHEAADQLDQLAAAGCIIAALVRQLDSHGAIVPYLPNLPPGQQSAATRMLAGAGLDCNGRRMRAYVVPSPAPKESGGVGATPSAEAVEAFLLTPKAAAQPDVTLIRASDHPTVGGLLGALFGAPAEPLPGRWGQQHSAPVPEGLLGLGTRGHEPLTPGPTLAEVQADRDYERRRANEAIAQLHDTRRELAALRVRVADGGKVVKA